MNLAEIFSYLTITLAIILFLLIIILIVRRSLAHKPKRRLLDALSDKGITIIDEEPEVKKHSFRPFKNKGKKKDEINEMVERLNTIVDKENSIEKREELITKEVEGIYTKLDSLKQTSPTNQNSINEDVKKVLRITDDLLEKLPDDVVNNFVKSKDFELYKKVIKQVK